MTRTSGNQRAPETEWKVEMLRLTTFHVPDLLANTQGWWSGLTNSEPESVVSKPKGGERAEVGRYEDWSLTLQVKTRPEGRIDWLAGGPAEFLESQEVPQLTTRLPLFVTPMRRWLQTTCPETKRLAFGAILNLDVASKAAGYETLSNYLEFNLSADSSDFLYQINRRRVSRVVPDLFINRLTKWSVGYRQSGSVTIHFDDSPDESARGEPTHHCRLELDINTAPEFGRPLPQDQLVALLDEMQRLSLEIVREGDIP